MRAINLKTEYMENPMGIDVKHPALSWNCEGGVTQSAYEISAAGDRGSVWESGKVESSRMVGIRYPQELRSGERIIWKVRLWDENGKQGKWSDEAYFEAGLLEASDWKGKWIAGDYAPKKDVRYPVDYFRKTFSLPGGDGKTITRARLYITACGVYEARLNGRRVGDFVMAPGVTDYKRRVQYQAYDVTELLNSCGEEGADGRMTLDVMLGDGWYRGCVGAWGLTCQYGTQTKFLAQLEMVAEDGSVAYIVSDDSWQWCNDGPIRFADNKDGEKVDFRKSPSYGGKACVTSHSVVPTASNNVPVREQERFAPRKSVSHAGKTLFDFGQNIAGYVEFTVKARRGDKLLLCCGEMLDEAGELTLKNIQCSNKKVTSPLQQVKIICDEGECHYKTTFAVFGFQYVEVTGTVAIAPEDMTAIAVYSDMEETGTFNSSNDLLNRFVDATRWSTKNNSLDLPTDCPTRERHGWTGDAQIFFDTASYLFNYKPFATKYVRDMYDWQREDGCLPQIVPEGGVDAYMYTMNGSVGWADAGVLIPYRMWKKYGDKKILEDYYEGMKRYAEFMIGRCGKWGGPMSEWIWLPKDVRRYYVNIGQSYGEWAEPTEVHEGKWTDMIVAHSEVSTAYTAYIMGLMEEIAGLLGRMSDVPRYREYHEGCRRAYQALVETKKYPLNTDRQANLVRPLYMGLLDERQEEYAKKRLLMALKNYRYRLGTGFLSTPWMLPVLEEIDLDVAYKVLENEEMPGWLFMTKMGATTIWESWEGTEAQGGIASLDHYSKGACVEWLFASMCGIRMDGENHFVIAPHPGGHFTYAKASYDSVYGKVESGWKRKGEETVYYISVPANTTAEIILLDGSSRSVTAGDYEFSC